MEWVQQHLVAALVTASGTVGAGALAWGVAKFGPGIIANKLKESFGRIRASGWLMDPAKPKRLAAYLALLELAEDELPEPGDASADAFFLRFGDWIASHMPAWLRGTASGWAKAARALSDETDKDLDIEIAEMKKVQEARKLG